MTDTYRTSNWALDAANEIYDGEDSSPQTIYDVILQHYPMKPDTAYMPVPRCDGCKHTVIKRPSYELHCTYLNMPTLGNFGCVQWKAKP